MYATSRLKDGIIPFVGERIIHLGKSWQIIGQSFDGTLKLSCKADGQVGLAHPLKCASAET